MPGFRFTRAATDDLLAIYLEGLERFGLAQADRYNDGLKRTFAFLAETPRAARLREEIDPPVRAHPFKAHMIVYEEVDDGVLILRVRHGREDWISSPEG
ncbi:type II toxin-antitoxin system RelE/ParE family toxin [Sphingomonas suaedae]|uniref:Type II toxin-antitoxin system RelE/ParE family toxin n=1 Tax=Sphingomonas suaedae TaxID=2599297 RepID=A0A518RBG2_9SPHN|nr:type II toxin-antitoxin system RelE/ParE family toxin [Sphingomonas suaedae]QDX24800.1 type II toxin-antitoxin system RelE/ParE family toxin [Sphingomonas suaedae]